MRTRHLLLGSSLLALLAAPATVASGQATAPVPAWSATPRQFETFYTQYRLDTGTDADRVRTEGMGGRLMWRLPAEPESTTLQSRTAVGIAAAYSRQRIGPTLNTQYVAAEGEVGLLPRPWLGRVNPFVGLGAGALRVHSTIPEMVRSPDADRTTIAFVLAPTIGTRFELGRGFGLRGEVRDLIAFDDGTRHNPAFGVGLSLTF